MPLGMLGKYERLDVLGHGVTGIVYLAKDTLLNKQVALKEVDVQAGDLRRFLEEARVMDRLRHPNIVRVNGVDRIDNKVIIDMEYVRGQNLQELLRAEGALPLERALEIAGQVLDALDYAHRMNTVHRDIKPANILVGRDGVAKLADFGLAEILTTNAYAGGAGTYAYMAPEDFAGENRSDNQSDIWAVGVTLFEMLTAHRPFEVANVKNPLAWKRTLETEAPHRLADFLPDAPRAIQAILDRALARDKRQRYQTAGEFRDDIRRFLAGEALAAPPREGYRGVIRRLFPANGRTNGQGLSTPARVLEESEADKTVAAVSLKAEPEEPAVVRQRRPFLGRKAEARLFVAPRRLDFGALHKGDLRSLKVRVRVKGLDGKTHGRVVGLPDWLSAEPKTFEGAAQTLTLTADSERAWETGEFQAAARVETRAGTTELPVHLTVLKPRRTFMQVALWYVPLFLATLLPALVVAFAGSNGTFASQVGPLVPSAAAASGLLAVMLLLVTIAADLGLAERTACGVLVVAMGAALGVALGRPHTAELIQGLQRAQLTGGVLGLMLLLQLLYLTRWKLWGVLVACLGLLVSGTFLRFLTY